MSRLEKEEIEASVESWSPDTALALTQRRRGSKLRAQCADNTLMIVLARA